MSSLILNATGDKIVMVIRCRVCGAERYSILTRRSLQIGEMVS